MVRLSLHVFLLLAGVSAASLAAIPADAAVATDRIYSFDIPAQDLGTALNMFARLTRQQVVFDPATVMGKRSTALSGRFNAADGLNRIIANSGLTARVGRTGLLIVQRLTAADPVLQEPAVASNDIIVTAQKREQKIQDVPIAISAFSGKTLDAMKIETGGDLLKSIPNVTFSKNNFAGYNFSIRGVGTKAVAASTDPGVAVAFNSSNLIVNRLFEQEFYDIERVEVLRGPQGTLYGRNATAGVVNIISHKADLDKVDGFFKVESGSYLTRRLSGAVNVPIIEDRLAIRAAGAYTKRDGYAVNDFYGDRIDGRDLFSTRLTVSAKPIDRLKADFIWEHFNENDDRQRAGKQLCHKDDGPTQIGNLVLDPVSQPSFSQGCKEGSLYDEGAFSTPNGRSLNAYQALYKLAPEAVISDANNVPIDPYGGVQQSDNLRHYSAVFNPRYRTRSDVFEANLTLDLGKIDLISQTLYDRDRYFSTEDYSRYISLPIFTKIQETEPLSTLRGAPDGYFDDPQIGRSNRLLAADLIRTKSNQFSQEVRLQSSDPSSRVQYVVGGNYTSFHYNADYNVFINTLTYLTQTLNLFSIAEYTCRTGNPTGIGEYVPGCLYADGNAIGKGPGDGRNYFRSINPYRLRSWGAFADVNFALLTNLKLIAGLRENDDTKKFDEVPSQLLLGTGNGYVTGYNASLAGFVDRRCHRHRRRNGDHLIGFAVGCSRRDRAWHQMELLAVDAQGVRQPVDVPQHRVYDVPRWRATAFGAR